MSTLVKATIEDLKNAPEKAELVNGEVVSMSPTGGRPGRAGGKIFVSLNNFEEAKKNYEEALKIDPQYFEAQLYLAKLVYADAASIKKEMSNLGITAADKKKRFELDKQLVEKLKIALPYWEKAEKLNPSDQEVLDTLYSIYTDLDLQDQLKRVEKRYKELGIEN